MAKSIYPQNVDRHCWYYEDADSINVVSLREGVYHLNHIPHKMLAATLRRALRKSKPRPTKKRGKK